MAVDLLLDLGVGSDVALDLHLELGVDIWRTRIPNLGNFWILVLDRAIIKKRSWCWSRCGSRPTFGSWCWIRCGTRPTFGSWCWYLTYADTTFGQLLNLEVGACNNKQRILVWPSTYCWILVLDQMWHYTYCWILVLIFDLRGYQMWATFESWCWIVP